MIEAVKLSRRHYDIFIPGGDGGSRTRVRSTSQIVFYERSSLFVRDRAALGAKAVSTTGASCSHLLARHRPVSYPVFGTESSADDRRPAGLWITQLGRIRIVSRLRLSKCRLVYAHTSNGRLAYSKLLTTSKPGTPPVTTETL